MLLTVPRRLTALATVSAMALATAAPAWSAPPPLTPRPSLQGASPPSLVGRLARITGTVSHHTADADQWSPAVLNFPVTGGDSYWTEPAARADIQVASSRITLSPSTEFDVTALDDQSFVATEPQGETYLELRAIPPGSTYTIETPRGAIQIAANGRYDITAGDTAHPTLITVVDGAAQVTGTNITLQVGPNQTASISGTDTFQGSVGPITQDTFLTAMLAEDRPPPRATLPIPPIVSRMTGCEDLQAIGTWSETPQYGTVWYPPVQSDWVPYREGSWSYVGDWGWTWVDRSPWGFAPFHYGRWAQVDGRWGWIPVSPGGYAEASGSYGTPVYAPALVSFIGGAALGAAVGFAAGGGFNHGPGFGGGGAVGWVPLGPREAYYPPYRANLDYVRSINATSVQNVNQTINQTNIVNNRNVVVQNFINRGAATVVPAAAMVQSTPIASVARPLTADQFSHAQAQFRAPVTPAAATVGVTPTVARQFNFTPARPAQGLPGPAINPALLRTQPGRPLAAPALRAAAGPGAAEPAAPTAIPPATEPNHAVPALRSPGAPEIRPGAPGPEIRPGATPELRPAAPVPGAAATPGAPELRPGVNPPEVRPGATPEAHPVAPATAPAHRPEPRPTSEAALPRLAPGPRPAPQPAPRAAAPRPAPPRPEQRAPYPSAFRPPPPAPRPPVARFAPPPRPAAPPPRAAAPPPRPAAPPRPAPRDPRHP